MPFKLRSNSIRLFYKFTASQTNFTDPQSKIMKQSNKGYDYSYNAQAVVDA